MISRVAEHCFWLQRYMERGESIASLLLVNRSFLLDINVPEMERWHPVLIVCGEQKRFPQMYSPQLVNDGETVQDYLTWDEQCPVGIMTSVFWARENARTIREVISREMWETLNTFWHWLRNGSGKKLYRRDRDAFYRRVRDSVALFQGVFQNTMLHEEPFDFMRLGMFLERTSQTARAMDVKHHLLGPAGENGAESAIESAQWMALLSTCSARDLFFRRYPFGIRGFDVVDFLLKEILFPRSIHHCLTNAWYYLRKIENSTGGRGVRSLPLFKALVERIGTKTTAEVLADGLHEELTRIIDIVFDVCQAIHSDFFDPGFIAPEAGALGA